MDKDRERLSYLLGRYAEGACSRQELDELFSVIKDLREEDSLLADYFRQEWEKYVVRDPVSGRSGAPRAEPAWEQMYERLAVCRGEGGREGRRIWKWPAAAALALLVLGAAAYFILSYEHAALPPSGIAAVEPSHPIVPGGNKAVLTLADGSSILLDSAANGVLAVLNDISIQKTGDGRVVYTGGATAGKASASAARAASAAPLAAMNSISTPRGGQYQVTLPDGSRVWLNASSQLRFPVSFDAAERRVELQGEAYFEVARDETRPFLVTSGGQTVRVLGTHFNVSAYPDEAHTRTTLLEGSVMVRESSSGKEQLLQPGQEATTLGSGNILLANVDPEQAIAWKNGKFVFDGESLGQIMRKVARWYDIEVVYEGDPSDIHFTGSVSRFADVSDVLRKLELTGMVRFEIKERRIIAKL